MQFQREYLFTTTNVSGEYPQKANLESKKLVNLYKSNIRRLTCIMAKRILKSSIEMMGLDDTNEIIFYQKRGLQYEFSFYGLNAI